MFLNCNLNVAAHKDLDLLLLTEKNKYILPHQNLVRRQIRTFLVS